MTRHPAKTSTLVLLSIALLLISAVALRAATLADYASRVSRAITLIDDVQRAYEHQSSHSSPAQLADANLILVRQHLPEKETVKLDGHEDRGDRQGRRKGKTGGDTAAPGIPANRRDGQRTRKSARSISALAQQVDSPSKTDPARRVGLAFQSRPNRDRRFMSGGDCHFDLALWPAPVERSTEKENKTRSSGRAW